MEGPEIVNTDAGQPAVADAVQPDAVAAGGGAIRRVLVWFDTSLYPEGVVRGTFAALVIAATIASFWHGKDWELPLTSAALLSMAWGYVAALDPRSALKAWCVGFLLVNFLLMELMFRWSAPTLAALAISGMAQYGFSRQTTSN